MYVCSTCIEPSLDCKLAIELMKGYIKLSHFLQLFFLCMRGVMIFSYHFFMLKIKNDFYVCTSMVCLLRSSEDVKT
jgi:hypothetical protein